MPDALLVSSSFLPGRGGIESYLAELCDRLAPSLAVLAPARRDKTSIPAGLPYPTSGYPGNMLWASRKIARAVVSEARRLGTDRVLFGTPWPLVLLGPRLRQAGLTYAVIVHGAELLVPAAVPLLKSKLSEALAGADLLLPVSRYTEDKLISFISKRSGRAVPPSAVLRATVDLNRFTPQADVRSARLKLGIDDSQKLVLAFGRLVKRKGVHRLIRVMPRLRREIPEAVLVVAGTGPELISLKRLAHRKRVPVIFAGRVPEEEAPALFAAADVFALPVSDRWFGLEVEGLGVVLLEASACETPCITGRSGGTPEAVIDGKTGLVVDAGKRDEIEEGLYRLLKDPEKAVEMGRAGRRHVAEHFSGAHLPGSLVDWLDRGKDSSASRS